MPLQCHGPVWAIDDISPCFQRKYVRCNGTCDVGWLGSLVTNNMSLALVTCNSFFL